MCDRSSKGFGMKTIGFHTVACLLGAAVSMGCGSTETEPTPAPPPAPDAAITRTVVTLHPDGTSETVTSEISRAEQLAELEARAARRAAPEAPSGLGEIRQPIARDVGCGLSSLLLFAGSNFTSSEICFYGPGSVSLDAYCRIKVGGVCYSTWAGSVRSFSSGSSAGEFSHANPACVYDSSSPGPFPSWSSEGYPNCAVTTATYISLYSW
jgi:hypothetical protein